ncbi:MAG: hypothetical protein ABSF90_20665 [Syntrophobacteraceae bacterium]
MAGNASGADTQAFFEEAFRVDAFTVVTEDLVLVNLPLTLDLRPLAVARAANERHPERRDARILILDRQDVVMPVATPTAWGQGVPARKRLSVEALSELGLHSRVTGATFDRRHGDLMGQLALRQIRVARDARQLSVDRPGQCALVHVKGNRLPVPLHRERRFAVTVKAVAVLMDRRALHSRSLMGLLLSCEAVAILRGRRARGAQQYHGKPRQQHAQEASQRATNVG